MRGGCSPTQRARGPNLKFRYLVRYFTEPYLSVTSSNNGTDDRVFAGTCLAAKIVGAEQRRDEVRNGGAGVAVAFIAVDSDGYDESTKILVDFEKLLKGRFADGTRGSVKLIVSADQFHLFAGI